MGESSSLPTQGERKTAVIRRHRHNLSLGSSASALTAAPLQPCFESNFKRFFFLLVLEQRWREEIICCKFLPLRTAAKVFGLLSPEPRSLSSTAFAATMQRRALVFPHLHAFFYSRALHGLSHPPLPSPPAPWIQEPSHVFSLGFVWLNKTQTAINALLTLSSSNKTPSHESSPFSIV